jgi:hypothetical protein
MGLLDEAIREHLELKRRSGADPSAVAREEHEALAPVFPSADHDAPDGDGAEIADEARDGASLEDEHSAPAHDQPQLSAYVAGSSTVGQETAELDMQAVIGEDAQAAELDSPVGPIADGAAHGASDSNIAAADAPGWGFEDEGEDGPG